MIDLMSATRGAVYRALTAALSPTPVYDDVPENTQPPFVKVGDIDSENLANPGDQFEKITIEIYVVYRGTDRGVMMGMIHGARAALDQQPITAPGIAFGLPRYLKMSVSDAWSGDGVTFAAVANFDVLAQPD